MTLRSYLTAMVSTTLLCWLSWVYILWSINPDTTNWIGFTLFYISLSLSLIGTAALIGFLIRFIGLKQTLAWRSAKEAFRQSFLFSSLIVISLFLQSRNLFSWLNLLLLIIGLTILEFFLISYKKRI